MIAERGNHPVRNPTAVDFWEPISANLIVRWGGSYQAVHDALNYAAARENGAQSVTEALGELYSSSTWQLASKLQKLAKSKWTYIPRKILKPLLGHGNGSDPAEQMGIEETDRIDFSRGGNSRQFTRSGWYDQEECSRWSKAEAKLRVVVEDGKNRTMTVHYRTHPGAKATAVLYNGKRVGELPHRWAGCEGIAAIILPGICTNKNGLQVISFETEGAMTSKEYFGGDVTDTRVLGVMVSLIEFTD